MKAFKRSRTLMCGGVVNVTLMAAMWCTSGNHASLRRRAVLYSSSVGGIAAAVRCPRLAATAAGRAVCHESCPGRGFTRPAAALDVRPGCASAAPDCLLYNTALSFCLPQKRKNLLLCCRGKETNVTSSNTHISSPSSDPNRPYPSTPALLSVCLSFTLLPGLVILYC